MDSLHAIGFYVSGGVSLAGGLGVALLPRRDQRGLALAVAGVGLAVSYLALSAGFAGAIALLCYIGAAWLIAGPRYRPADVVAGALWRQLGAIGAAGLLVLLLYSAFRGNFVSGAFHGGAFGTASLGRLFLGHDALATEAVVLLAFVALAGATLAWRARERQR